MDILKWKTTQIFNRTYDPGGRLSTSTYGNGVMTTWTYRDDGSTKRDNMLDTIATTHPAGVTDTVGDYSYTWDANKNKTSESITGVMSPYGFNSAAGQHPAAYDADDRLVGWNRNDGNLDQAWTLTPVGDWDLFTEEAVTQDRSHGPAHEITDVTIGASERFRDDGRLSLENEATWPGGSLPPFRVNAGLRTAETEGGPITVGRELRWRYCEPRTVAAGVAKRVRLRLTVKRVDRLAMQGLVALGRPGTSLGHEGHKGHCWSRALLAGL